ncbi:MAG: Tol biopolymer transporter [Methanomethylovorans sp.]|uniref:TolB family protein n=1 Tax=Methanomethylovorans sp. TaxID=2758717 RepID=UPI0035315715
MRQSICIIVTLLSIIGPATSEPIYPNANTIAATNSVSINNLIHADKGFDSSSTYWSPDGKFLLFRSFESISMSESINKHYLLDVENKKYGKIDYGITEKESNYIGQTLGWTPCGNKIYFSVLKIGHGRGTSGSNAVICDPDGTNMRAVDSKNKSTLSNIIANLGGDVMYGDLTFNPDCNKISFEYEDPGNFVGDIRIESFDGTNPFDFQTDANDLVWCNSTIAIVQSCNGSIVVSDVNRNIIYSFTPPSESERYLLLSVSPDKKKLSFMEIDKDDNIRYYISNIDGSEPVSIDKSNLEFFDEVQLEFGIWQPNGSGMLLIDNGDLYVIEGNVNKKRLLYEGNATHPQWFPDGNKILFIENGNQMCSIDLNGTNFSHITDIGFTTPFAADTYQLKQISISPSGNTIAFTSGLDQSGKMVLYEPSIESQKYIASPLFIINSDGTNLIQLTSAVKGRHDFLEGWSQNGKMLTVNCIQFTRDEIKSNNSYIFSLDGANLTDGWQEMPVSKILGKDSIVQSNNSSQASVKTIGNKDEAKDQNTPQSPAFQMTDLFVCITCVYLLKLRK